MAIDPALIQAEILRRMLDVRLCREVAVASPAVGAEFSSGPASGFTWDLLSAKFTFTTSAVVATRTPTLALVDADSTRIWRAASATTLAASLSREYDYLCGFGASVANLIDSLPLPCPASIVQSGMTVRSVTASLDAGDQYSGILLYVREYSAAQIAAVAGDISEQFSSEVIGGLVV